MIWPLSLSRSLPVVPVTALMLVIMPLKSSAIFVLAPNASAAGAMIVLIPLPSFVRLPAVLSRLFSTLAMPELKPRKSAPIIACNEAMVSVITSPISWSFAPYFCQKLLS
jgi:hypothetical protein